ncbi:MAG: DMT family transporter [Oscillospiraceae bacterium]|nr:DMT family transporter [Oscillospiraceae bacterium]
MWWIILLAILGGGIPTFAKLGLEEFPMFTYLFLRFTIALLVLMPLYIRSKEKINRKNLRKIVLVSLLGTGNAVLFAAGVALTSATAAQLMYALTPTIVAVFSIIILRAYISKQKILGILLGLIGVTVITLFTGTSGGLEDGGSIIGNVLILLAVISYSLYTVYSKKIQNEFSPIVLTTMLAITTIIASALFLPRDIINYDNIFANVTYMGIIAVLYNGVIGIAVYFVLYQRVIKKTNPLIASTLLYLQPVGAFLWASVMLGEGLSIALLGGSVFILSGAGLVNYAKDPSGKKKDEDELLEEV